MPRFFKGESYSTSNSKCLYLEPYAETIQSASEAVLFITFPLIIIFKWNMLRDSNQKGTLKQQKHSSFPSNLTASLKAESPTEKLDMADTKGHSL